MQKNVSWGGRCSLKKSLKIGLDFDGVIADSQSLKPLVAKEMFGVDIPLASCSNERVVDHGLTLEQYRVVKESVYHGKYAFEPVAESLFYISLLQRDGNHVRVVTARDGHTLQLAQEWMREQNITLEIEVVGYKTSKLEACRDLDVYIDDDPEKLVPLIGTVPHVLLYLWPFNRECCLSPRIERVSSWYDIYNYIRHET